VARTAGCKAPEEGHMSIWSRRATQQPARRSVEQGSAQRGAGARLRDATVEPIKRVASNADPCASPGVRSQRVPLPPLDAPRLRGCDRGGVHRHADSIRRAWPAAGSHLRPRAQALLRPPRAVLAATRVGRGDLGAYCCRSPLQYRHIAAGDPKSASHIASVAHVPIHEIGSSDS
jgi:hypothetical protein